MKHNEVLWKSISAVLTVMLVIAIFATIALTGYADTLNAYFGISTGKLVETGEPTGDTTYFKSEFGEWGEDSTNTEIRNAIEQACYDEMAEGAVLMKNNGAALPLEAEERSVTLFGHASFNPYSSFAGGLGGSTGVEADFITLKAALENEGFQINETLYNAYENDPAQRPTDARGKGGYATGTENPGSFYRQYESSWQNDYNDVAIITIARQAGESMDMVTDEIDDDGVSHISSLALHSNEREMIEVIAEGGFKKVIVLINSPYMLELGWVDEYDIDACLWINTPGTFGFGSVAKILTGEINPSGQLVDTWAADSLSAPAMANANDRTPVWQNVDEIWDSGVLKQGLNASVFDTPSVVSYVNVQQENIYIGYKYYETRYADIIMGKGGASSGVGAFASSGDSWNYAEEMCYPFGWGLSYTTFTQQIENVVYDADKDVYTVSVRVTNSGNVPGKKAVLVYAQTPYGDYEQENFVEKSAIQLVGYGKTDILAPDQAELVEVEVDRYLLASYDSHNAKGYVLSGGEYYFAVGESAHDALNNVLAAQGYTGMYDHEGNLCTGKEEEVVQCTIGVPARNDEPDTTAYAHSAATGKRVTNLFDYADYNYWKEYTGTTVTYLTRQNWEDTFPTQAAQVVLKGEEMERFLQNDYEMAADALSVSDFQQNVSNGINIVDMREVEYESPLWDDYLDQFTLEELAMQTRDKPGSYAVEKVGLPDVAHGDGCLNVSIADNGRINFPSTLSSSWNKELQSRHGELMGEAYGSMGINTACNGGGNLHRTPFCGRQAEYPSEDATVNYYTLELQYKGMASKGVLAGPKHFGGNDQEYNRLGCIIFATEQGLREGTLRGFESALRSDMAACGYTMPCNFRIGMKWVPANSELLTDLLRGEWGFEGITNLDCGFKPTEGFWSQIEAAVMAGTDSGYGNTGDAYLRLVEWVEENDDGDMLQRLREVTKNLHYMTSHSNAMNGLSSTTEYVSILPTWQLLMYIGVSVLAALAIGSLVILAAVKVKVRNKKKGAQKI